MLMMSRLSEGVTVAIAMCFSWSVFYGFQMILAGSTVYFEHEGELLSVCLALLVSFFLMFGLIPLDWLADQEWTDERHDRAIRSIIDAMALTIGFSWEQCFDACVDALAITSKGVSYDLINPHTTKLGLTVFCAGLLVPAWKWYMLPYIVGKGWRYGFILKIDDLDLVTERMIKAHGEEDGGSKIAKVREVLEQSLEKVSRKVGGSAANLAAAAEAGAGTYAALPGDDVAALTEKNKQLSIDLAKAKAASLKCQQMLDQTMESMFSSLKQMNATVTKFEQQQ